MKLTRYGPHAWLLGFAERADETAFRHGQFWLTYCQQHFGAGLLEPVPAFTTLLLVFAPGSVPSRVELPAVPPGALSEESRSGRLREIPVHYGGADLGRVANRARLSEEEVIERHCGTVYRVHCLGFAPGFPYLGGLDPRLHTPRLATPRPRVPAGSVAIGGEHAGIYSIASPGGWNLIGTTSVPLFQPDADRVEAMFLLRPGDRVKFLCQQDTASERPVDASILRGRPSSESDTRPWFRVLSPGLGLWLQDLGRPGYARFGMPPGGAMDPLAATWANRLLDNPPETPVLELCLQGQRLEMLRDGWVAWTGSVGGASSRRPAWSAFRVRCGEILEFPPAPSGVWSYVAVPGGLVGTRILGSVSTHPRAQLGTRFPTGDVIGGNEAGFVPPPSTATRRTPWTEVPHYDSPLPIRVWPAPQQEAFSVADRARFFATEWIVSAQCDRTGYRLNGPALKPEPPEIVSEPVLPGSIQVPANGQPIVTMPDGPTLGGYPKLGLVDPGDLARVAQTRPGQRIRFCPVQDDGI